MFLLVSGRHVGAHLGGHQHGVSIQISINLGKTFLRISSIRKIAVTWILARVFAYILFFYFQILGLIYWTVLIFYFDLFWMAWHWKPAITKLCQGENKLRHNVFQTQLLNSLLLFFYKENLLKYNYSGVLSYFQVRCKGWIRFAKATGFFKFQRTVDETKPQAKTKTIKTQGCSLSSNTF